MKPLEMVRVVSFFIMGIGAGLVVLGLVGQHKPAPAIKVDSVAQVPVGGLGPVGPTSSRQTTDPRKQSVSRVHGLEIYWGSEFGDGASPLDAINATIGRIQFEQGTDKFASDQNARALAFLMLARQELEGKTTTTEDGFPILE